MSQIAVAAPGHAPSEEAMAALLTLRLSWLSYFAFSLAVERLLQAEGYIDIRHLGRLYLKGRTMVGGIDLIADRETPAGHSRVLMQLKRWDRTVPRHFVDELRGAMLRLDAPEGLILTTSTYSTVARQAATDFPGRPVRLISGEELGQLLLRHRIGVVEQVDLSTGVKRLVLDEEAFERLERHAQDVKEYWSKAQGGGR